jgi:putative ABC transport system permease protein
VLRNWRQIAPALADMLKHLRRRGLGHRAAIVVALAALGMVNTMLMAIHERTREFGVLRAIGMDKRWLLLMVLIESLGLALSPAAIGSLLGVVAALVLINGLLQATASTSAPACPTAFDMVGINIDPVMPMHLAPDARSIYAGVLLVVAMAMLAALLPSWRVMRAQAGAGHAMSTRTLHTTAPGTRPGCPWPPC